MFHYGHIFNFNPWTLRAVAGLAGLIELPETADRSAGTTSVFFRRGEQDNALPILQNPANAERVLRMIELHYAGGFRKGKAAKPFVKLFARMEETIASLMKSPSAIGIRIARKLQQKS